MGKTSNLSTATMNPCAGHRQYLANYSQDDDSKFSPPRKFWENVRGRV